MLDKVTWSVAGSLAVIGAYVVHEGAVRVAVDEQKRGGHHMHLFLPAAFVPVALKFVPDQKMREASMHVHPWLPAIEAASHELVRLPDSDLVEVRAPRQHLSIKTRDARLMIDVESPGGQVSVSFPLRTVGRVARELEAVAPAS